MCQTLLGSLRISGQQLSDGHDGFFSSSFDAGIGNHHCSVQVELNWLARLSLDEVNWLIRAGRSRIQAAGTAMRDLFFNIGQL